MTSDTSPRGSSFASTVHSTNYAYKAFDADEATLWVSASAASAYIGYTFAKRVTVTRFYMSMQYNSVPTYSATLEYSDDSVNWTPVATRTGITEQYTFLSIDCPNSGEHVSYRIKLEAATVTNFNIHELQFYGYSIGTYPLLPSMTSSNTPTGYEVTNTTSYQSRDAWKACGGYGSLTTLTMPDAKIYITLPEAKVVTQFEYKSDNTGQGIKQFAIYGSNDNSTFFQLCSDTLSNVNTLQIYEIGNSTPYRYYRIDILASYASGSVYSDHWNLNGY